MYVMDTDTHVFGVITSQLANEKYHKLLVGFFFQLTKQQYKLLLGTYEAIKINQTSTQNTYS